MNTFSEEEHQFQEAFSKEKTQFWNSLTKEQQLLAFCFVMDKLYEGEVVDKRSYRGVLYETFGFDHDSYIKALVSHFLEIHNLFPI